MVQFTFSGKVSTECYPDAIMRGMALLYQYTNLSTSQQSRSLRRLMQWRNKDRGKDEEL